MGGEYAGGAASLNRCGRRVGVVVANGFVILLLVTRATGDILVGGDVDDMDDLDSFFEVNRLKLKGMLGNLEGVLIEQKVGAGERVAIFNCNLARTRPWL